MSIKKRNRFQFYIRRMRGSEKASDFRTAYRLAFGEQLSKKGKRVYVLVQRGRQNTAVEVGLIGGKKAFKSRMFNLKKINQSIRKKQYK